MWCDIDPNSYFQSGWSSPTPCSSCPLARLESLFFKYISKPSMSLQPAHVFTLCCLLLVRDQSDTRVVSSSVELEARHWHHLGPRHHCGCSYFLDRLPILYQLSQKTKKNQAFCEEILTICHTWLFNCVSLYCLLARRYLFSEISLCKYNQAPGIISGGTIS